MLAAPPLPQVRTQEVIGYLGDARVGLAGRPSALIADGIAALPPSRVDTYMDRQVEILRDDLQGTGVEVVRQGEDIVLRMPSDVTFAFDKAEIQPRFYRVLDAVARTLNEYPATYVDVTGHADAIGSDAYNQVLSERRASAVARYLVGRRALPDRLWVAGRGERDPIASNATVQGRAYNRRVEIVLSPHTSAG